MTDTVEQPMAPAEPAPPSRPRIRVTAVVWGLIMAAAAAGVIWLVLSPARSATVTDWVILSDAHDWTVVVVVAVLAVGVIILIASLLAALRRWQTRHERQVDTDDRTRS